MKKLKNQFTMNADKVGDNIFTQLKREGKVAIYMRSWPDGEVKSYEVFIIKTVEKGTPLPNGKTVEETYESYPGAASFGKSAYDCKTIESAEDRFVELMEKVKNRDDAKEEAIKTGQPVRRGRKPSVNKKVVPVPTKNSKFTMKMMVSDTGEKKPNLYIIVQKWIADGLVRVAGTQRKEGQRRGRAEVVYEVV